MSRLDYSKWDNIEVSFVTARFVGLTVWNKLVVQMLEIQTQNIVFLWEGTGDTVNMIMTLEKAWFLPGLLLVWQWQWQWQWAV